MTQEMKVRENRLRRMADRRGFRLEKSRRRDEKAPDFGGYMLVDVSTNTVVVGAHHFAYDGTLDDIESYLEHGRPAGLPTKV